MNKLFGTTGVRKIFGTELTPDMALELGLAFGTYLQSGTVIVGRDVRTSSPIVQMAFQSGLMASGIDVVDAGVIPTPTLAFSLKNEKYTAGVIITASHNPPEYVGIKFWGKNGLGVLPEEERKIEKIYFEKSFNYVSWDKVGNYTTDSSFVPNHIDYVLNSISSDLIRTKKFEIAIDPGNGAASLVSPYLLRKLNVRTTALNSHPDGYFPGRKSEPNEESLGELISLIKNKEYDLGIAHDGDADRVVFIDETGKLHTGDRVITMIALRYLKKKKGTIVTTVDSSFVLDELVKKAGGTVIRTPVGDIQVAYSLYREHGIFGGESCGVFIFPEHHYGPDTLMAIGVILEIMTKENKKFSELMSEIPEYPHKRASIKCPNELKDKVMSEVGVKLPGLFNNIVKIVDVDGYGLIVDDGWILVRPSGTEPKIRITCESTNESKMNEYLSRVTELISSILNSIV